jgi:hypothetical protein
MVRHSNPSGVRSETQSLPERRIKVWRSPKRRSRRASTALNSRLRTSWHPHSRVKTIEGQLTLSHCDKIFRCPGQSGPWCSYVVPCDRILDLSSRMDASGRITAYCLPGVGTALGYTSTGQLNHTAPESGRGLECDKFSKEAIGVAFNALLGRLIADNPGLTGTGKALVQPMPSRRSEHKTGPHDAF